MVLVNLNGMMVLFMKDNIKQAILREMEHTIGLMENIIKDNGLIIRCMEKVCSTGMTVKSIKVCYLKKLIKDNIKMIKRKDMGSFIGLMAEYIKDNGLMVYNTVKEF